MPYKDPVIRRLKANEYGRAYYQRNKELEAERNRAYILKTKYGTTIEEYTARLEEQGGVCAICGEACRTGRNLAQDHNHDTGLCRGLLCTLCNSALSRLEENNTWPENARAYLARWELDDRET